MHSKIRYPELAMGLLFLSSWVPLLAIEAASVSTTTIVFVWVCLTLGLALNVVVSRYFPDPRNLGGMEEFYCSFRPMLVVAFVSAVGTLLLLANDQRAFAAVFSIGWHMTYLAPPIFRVCLSRNLVNTD